MLLSYILLLSLLAILVNADTTTTVNMTCRPIDMSEVSYCADQLSDEWAWVPEDRKSVV